MRRDYRAYIAGPVWSLRRRRQLLRRPWCLAHGRPCRAQTVHHASYLGWRYLGREFRWETMSLCRAAHGRISRWHQGIWVPSLAILAISWAVVGWARLGMAVARLRHRGAS